MKRLGVLVLLVVAGCAESHTPVVMRELERRAPLVDLDVLIVMENLGPIDGRQYALQWALMEVLPELATGDRDGDGAPDTLPFRSIHAGVTLGDVGGGVGVPPELRPPTCVTETGNDGLLVTGRSFGTDCAAPIDGMVTWTAGDDLGAALTELGCVVTRGEDGCGIEQPLEASLRALATGTPTAWTADGYVAPEFESGPPHGDRENAWLFRPDAVLLVVYLVLEDDGSASDPFLYTRTAPYETTGLNLRAFTFPEALHPLSRYRDGLLGVRREPWQLAFVPLGGVPSDLWDPEPSALVYDRVLADPRMIPTTDPSASPPTRLLGSCTPPDGGEAFAPARIVALGRELARAGATTAIGSICTDAMAFVLRDTVDAARSPRWCIPVDSLERAADGTPACTVEAWLPAGERCDEELGRAPTRIELESGESVEVCTLDARFGAGAGFDGCPEGTSRVTLASPALLDAPGRLRARCTAR